jgi:hypothetical protein
MKATIGRLSPGRNTIRLTLSRLIRSPAGPTDTETRNEYHFTVGWLGAEVPPVPPEVDPDEVVEPLEVTVVDPPKEVEVEVVVAPVVVAPAEDPVADVAWLASLGGATRVRKGFLLSKESSRRR